MGEVASGVSLWWQQRWGSRGSSRVQAKPAGLKRCLDLALPEDQRNDQSGPDVLPGSSRATSSRGQHASVCSPALLLLFWAFFCS